MLCSGPCVRAYQPGDRSGNSTKTEKGTATTHTATIEAQTQREHLQTNTCAHAVHIREVNLALVGLPPYDLLDELAKALREKGLDIDEVFQKAVSCSNEFLCPVVNRVVAVVPALCTM